MGSGVIVFCVWSIVKSVLGVLLGDYGEYAEQFVAPSVPDDYMTVFLAIAGALVLLDIVMGIYVGISARREGLGRSKKSHYLPFAVILALLEVASLCVTIPDLINGSQDIVSGIITLLIDLTSLFTLVQLVVSAVRVRRQKRQAG